MGWGDPEELVELHGASGKTWKLRFIRSIWPKEATVDAPSTVYLMRDALDGKVYVAKTQFADTPQELDGLIAEAATWRRISVAHQNNWPRNIVKLYDVFITRGPDSSVVYLMELCEQGNLPRRMPEGRVLDTLDAVTSAVQSMVDSEVPVHGNVTYETVLVTKEETVKLAGFGASRAYSLRSSPSLRSSDDVLAIGQLGFELLVGRAPSIQETQLPPNVAVNDRLRGIINTALGPDQSRPDISGFSGLIHGRGSAGGGLQRPPIATASIRHGVAPPLSQASGGQRRSSLVDTVQAQQSVRGTQPPLSVAGRQPGLDSNRKASLIDAVAASGPYTSITSDGRGGAQRKFSSLDPFGLASRQNKPGENFAETEALVVSATDSALAPIDFAAVRKLVSQQKELGTAPDIYRALFKRPISTDPIIAFKSLTLVHFLMVEGSLEFIDMTLRQTKFYEWIEQTWTAAVLQTKVDAHKYNFAFVNGEIAEFASFLRMKALFHYKTAYAFNGDWSRSNMLSEDGKDSVKGRERKILSGLADLMELAEHVASLIFVGNDPCRVVKVLPIPLLVSEIIRGYEGACEMADGVENLNSRKKLVPAFNRCHERARKVLEALQLSPELSATVPEEIRNIQIDGMPPDIAAEPQPEYHDEGPPQSSEMPEDGEDGSDAGEKKKKKKKKKKEKESEEAEGTSEANAQIEANAPPEGTLVPFQENKMGLLVRYATEHDAEPEEGEPVERAANPNIANAELLADILGESPQQAEDEEGEYSGGNSLALVLTEEAREEERMVLREARERSAAYSMALTVVGEAPVIEKTHPAFCQCMMCDTATTVQKMTVYGAEDSDEEVSEGVRIDTDEVPENFLVNPKEVKLGKQIGEGGFGAVYKGKFKRKDVAVKKIAKNLLTDDHVYRNLKHEVALMCHLDHVNILKLVGASTKKSNFMILLEFMTRGSLFDMIHKAGARLSWPIVKRLAMSTATGMAYLHSKKILHRDLKSSNIMVDSDFSVKIGDFGIAVVLSGDDDDGHHNRHGFAGTYQYMAPEILAEQPYTEKSDVYAFAIVLWEMVSLQLPFYGMDPTTAANYVVETGLRPPIPQFCSQPVAVLISSCWNQEPTLRPSFSQIIELLKRIPG